MSIRDCVQEVAAQLSGEGLRVVYEVPRGTPVLPAALVYVQGGRWDSISYKTTVGLHNIVIDLHVVRADLARAFEEVMSHADSVPAKLYQALWDKQFTHIVTFERIDYSLLQMRWGDVETIGYRWTLVNVKTIDRL